MKTRVYLSKQGYPRISSYCKADSCDTCKYRFTCGTKNSVHITVRSRALFTDLTHKEPKRTPEVGEWIKYKDKWLLVIDVSYNLCYVGTINITTGDKLYVGVQEIEDYGGRVIAPCEK